VGDPKGNPLNQFIPFRTRKGSNMAGSTRRTAQSRGQSRPGTSREKGRFQAGD